MATMILLPDGASGHTYHWAANTGTHEDCLDDDNGDTSYVACSAANRQLNVTYANPSVAEADIASPNGITSVRFLSSGRSTHRTTDSEVDIKFLTPTDYGEETMSYDNHASDYETINGTPRSTSDGSATWTYSDLENLSMKCTKNGSIQVRLSYLALEVTYTEAAVTDNATFFGANF
jgi:hypothetical protein